MDEIERKIILLIKKLGHINTLNYNSSQLNILRVLYENGVITQKNLTSYLNIKPASVSELLEKLQRKDLIYRTPNRLDHRILDIHLTEYGKSFYKEILSDSQNEENIFSVLTDPEKETLLKLLEKLEESKLINAQMLKEKRFKIPHKPHGKHFHSKHKHHKRKF